MIRAFILSLLLSTHAASGQQRVLHYTETSGYDHGTRTESLQMFETIASLQGWQVVNDQSGDEFNTLINLQQHDVVVFSNTSGDAILNVTQRINFEAYIAGGGSYLGIHAASDTYRHSTANGTNVGSWDFYSELVGASVQQNPNHVSGTPQYSMDVIGMHPSTQNVPNPWSKNEEYYYWENGYYGSNNTSVLQVEETVGPNNFVNSYDSERPMSWYRELAGGGKMFYTALGHAASNFSFDQNFFNHIRDALIWMIPQTVGVNSSNSLEEIRITNHNGSIILQNIVGASDLKIAMHNSMGQLVFSSSTQSRISTNSFPAGVYTLVVVANGQRVNQKLVIGLH